MILWHTFFYIGSMLNRAGVWFHTDLKDFEDVDFTDYPHRLSTVLQGRVGMVRGRPQPEWNTCRVCEWPTMPVFAIIQPSSRFA